MLFISRLFRRRPEPEEEAGPKKPPIPTAQCKMMKDMSLRIAKTLGKTKDGDKYIYEDKILFIKIANDLVDIAVKVEQDDEALRVPVFVALLSATAPRLYQAGSWTDHIIDDLYPRATRKAWDKALNMRDLGAIKTPAVKTTLID